MSRYGLDREEVTEWIRAKAEERGLTLVRLAEHAGMAERTLHRTLNAAEDKKHQRALADIVEALGGRLKFEYDIEEIPE
jgi:AraC-like DNA-binding protein